MSPRRQIDFEIERYPLSCGNLDDGILAYFDCVNSGVFSFTDLCFLVDTVRAKMNKNDKSS